MALEAYCAACTYLGEKSDSYGKYYCSKKGDRYACDPKCGSFCEAYRRSTSARENMYNNSRSHQSGGCYLTTAMCNVLGYPDDNYYLQILRTFRDNTLKKDTKYLPLLLTYDIVGPQIAQNLEQDENKTEIAKTLLTRYITPAINAIENNKENEAVVIYTAMTTLLAEKYNINLAILYINPEDIDIHTIDMNSLGHGKKRKKTYEKPDIQFIQA